MALSCFWGEVCGQSNSQVIPRKVNPIGEETPLPCLRSQLLLKRQKALLNQLFIFHRQSHPRPVKPCLSAFTRDRIFPVSVFGPVLRWACNLFASIRASLS